MKKMIGICPQFVKDIIESNTVKIDFSKNLLENYKNAWINWLSTFENQSVKGLSQYFYQTNGVHDALVHLINSLSPDLFQIFTQDYPYYEYLLEKEIMKKYFP